jgi:hypothetical protein
MALQTVGRSDEIVETLHLLRFSSIHLHYLQTDLCYRVHDDFEIAASGQQRLSTPYCQWSDRVLIYEQDITSFIICPLSPPPIDELIRPFYTVFGNQTSPFTNLARTAAIRLLVPYRAIQSLE